MRFASALCALLALGGVARAGVGDAEVARIVQRNIFCSGCTPAPTTTGGAPASALAFELVSTMIAHDAQDSAAVVRELATRARQPRLVRRGDRLDDAEVLAVVPRRVYLRRAGRVERLELGEAAQVADVAPPRASSDGVQCRGRDCVVERSVLQAFIADPSRLGSVRVLPTPEGFRVFGLRPDSPLAHAGLENGDVLAGVNGTPLRTLADAVEAYPRLRSANRISLALKRRGESISIDYAIR